MKLIAFTLASLVATSYANFFSKAYSAASPSKSLTHPTLPENLRRDFSAEGEEAMKCYDMNGDSVLDIREVISMQEHLAEGGKCPSKAFTNLREEVETHILNENELQDLDNWIAGGATIKYNRLYSSYYNRALCEPDVWRNSVVGKKNILIVAKTRNKNKVGIFTQKGYDNFNTYHLINDETVRIISFTNRQSYQIKNSFYMGTKVFPYGDQTFAMAADTLWFFGEQSMSYNCRVGYDTGKANSIFQCPLDVGAMLNTDYYNWASNAIEEVNGLETFELVF